jgi:hypothetical protein
VGEAVGALTNLKGENPTIVSSPDHRLRDTI